MATKAERNARLDALQAAAQAWAAAQKTELQRRVTVAKRILQGRTGAERLTRSTVDQASALVVDSIDDFLVVD